MYYFNFSAAMDNSCSRNMLNMTVENAFLSCFTNNICIAECYRGYIFPTGHTKESYFCQNRNWVPVLSSCKSKLVV